MEQRGREYRRKQRDRAIRRKKRIGDAVYDGYYFKYDGQYSKGHIGCGCGFCKPGKRFGEPSETERRKSAPYLSYLKEYREEGIRSMY